MSIHQQGPFEEGEVPEIQKRLSESYAQRHAANMIEGKALKALFGDDWRDEERAIDAGVDDADEYFADLNELLEQTAIELLSKPPTTTTNVANAPQAPELGQFAGEPSYSLLRFSRSKLKVRTTDQFLNEPLTQRQANQHKFGVNAKPDLLKPRSRSLSTPGRAGLIANFHLGHAERIVAINALKELDLTLTQCQIEKLLKIDAFIHQLAREYQGTGELPDWAKFLSPEMKQFFRIFQQCTQPDAKTITIRLDHKTAAAALAAPRGPANYLAEIIKRALAKLGIETELTFNLEFNHTGRTENHPAHIHGALCIPDDRVVEVIGALRRALAEGYRQRYTNLAVHIEAPRSARSWAIYCIKEYDLTAIRLFAERLRKTRPEYATQTLTQQAKDFYESIGAWINS
ncbi:hypothetical protein [Pseudomonas viridiflava]|uniref:hypothetical protein n=1 Tax=Pseudomonas viridiflava TaxID=33069 RepID=UPI000F053090|nr:hypothetical protein [Pseudomonas viridiflava]